MLTGETLKYQAKTRAQLATRLKIKMNKSEHKVRQVQNWQIRFSK